jgi:transposase
MMKARTKPTVMEVDMSEVADVLRRAEAALDAKDYALLKMLVDSHAYLAELLADKEMSLARLRRILFGASTEKTAAVTGRESASASSQPPRDGESAASPAESPQEEATPDADSQLKPKRPGHGRNGADAYPGAEQISVPHATLQPGNPCPDCTAGTVYRMATPAVLVRFTGQAPVQAKVYRLEKLRCSLCGKIFTAEAPEGVGTAKYDATAASMIGLLKYGTGMPFNRFGGLQGNLGIPLPASTQWDIVHKQVPHFEPIHAELVYLAGQGELLYNDDTPAKILALMGNGAEQAAAPDSGQKDVAERRGLFTTGIISVYEGHRIALFFSGRKHAGENLKDVLARRVAELGAPIQMCDALSRNLPGELETIVANCLAHGRRQFVDVVAYFPEECEYVLDALKVVYHNDAVAREQGLSPEARLAFHQAESGPTMQALHAWLGRQLDERLVEPNSSLGKAIGYMLRHWPELTLFLRRAGAPLDNNLCERALKKAILHRKNSLFFKTENGARVGDIYMSLIHTCELCGANAFDYLTELQRHATEAALKLRAWLPWNYRQTLAAVSPPPALAAS